MKKMLMVCLLTAFLLSTAFASNDKIFIVSFDSADELRGLTDYPGRYWGKTTDRVFLCGGLEEGVWLNDNGFRFEDINFNSEDFSIYLVAIDNMNGLANDIDVLYEGDGFVLSSKAPEGDYQFRKLDLKRYPKTDYNISYNVILEYNSVIDNIISQVTQDTIMQFLTGLSGEAGVWVNGQMDTIATRYSPTEDNVLHCLASRGARLRAVTALERIVMRVLRPQLASSCFPL